MIFFIIIIMCQTEHSHLGWATGQLLRATICREPSLEMYLGEESCSGPRYVRVIVFFSLA